MGAGGLSRILAVAANTFRETIREKVLYNLVFFALLMTLAGLLLQPLSIRQDEKIIKDIGLASLELFGTVIALFMGVSLVSKEIERRSLYPLLAKPLSRQEFLIGKFAGLAFTLMVNVSVMTLGIYLTLWATGKPASPALLQAVFPIYLGLLLVVAVALLFSTLMSSAPMALVCSVCLVAAGHFADVIRNMHEVTPGVPGWITQVVYYALPNFRNFDLKTRVVYGEPVSMSDLGWIALYAGAYITVALGVAVSAFRSKDLQ